MNDWAEYGLMQDPSARTGADGDFNLVFSDVYPYQRYELQATPLPWLEAVFRYTAIQNRLYGPISFSGTQSYKDKSFGIKIRLARESADFPAMALGIRDITGTGLFGSEYLVFSRRYYDWDFTWGVGWGQMGTQDVVPNPLGLISHYFRTRPTPTAALAQSFSFNYFRGKSVGLFGGFEYHTPLKGLTLKVELDPDSYQEEPLGNSLSVRSPINVGLDYRLFNFLDISAGFERGTTAMLRFTIHGNLNTGPLFNIDTPPPATKVRPLPKPAAGGSLDQSQIPEVADSEPRATAAAFASGPPREAAYYHEGRPLDQSRIPQISWLKPNAIDQIETTPASDGRPRTARLSRVDRLYDGANRLGYDIDAISLRGDTAIVRVSARHNIKPTTRVQLAQLVTSDLPDVRRAIVTVSRPQSDPPTTPPLFAPIASSQPLPRLELMSEVKPPQPVRPNVRAIAAKIFHDLSEIKFVGHSFAIRGDRAYLVFSQNTYFDLPIALGHAARIVMRYLPPSVEAITLDLKRQNLTVLSVTLMRRDLENGIIHLGSPEEIWADARFSNADSYRPKGVVNDDAYPSFSWSLGPRTRQQIGGPNSFFLYQIYANLGASANLMPGLSVTSDVGINLYNDFNKLTYPSNSLLPHVRSDIAKYLKQGATGIYRLQTDYLFNIAPSLYGRVSAGYLEEMFAGVDSEVLYRPYDERWAVGLDLNHVWQRNYNDLFGLRKYNVTTGHLSFYYQLPFYHVLAHVYVGQYLAGDRGATIQLSRQFDNGIRLGAFATFTNADGAKFGEGNFDKGIFISIPLDLLFGQPSKDVAGYLFRPLTRDGGQMLEIAKPLYDMTDGTDASTLGREWPGILK
jgi:Exopolysaccharide biosynthesis protein YbjH